ncbi:Plasmodium exported protein, unknown function [Plasmodium ovale]|uniref:Pv-fam-d protein n=2 Tax=Plasmodium ovale TaxID=36330 RepID=A0A1A8XDA7_PLAOA|nr:Pv-fam-d protein [Plasmodium ovale curtisi]SBT01842.1 Pv-fam-d protein [Plasmodium ovale curtisi]SBT84345.1 Plasmodium exported protein, unknown function [Plasmodium ovale]
MKGPTSKFYFFIKIFTYNVLVWTWEYSSEAPAFGKYLGKKIGANNSFSVRNGRLLIGETDVEFQAGHNSFKDKLIDIINKDDEQFEKHLKTLMNDEHFKNGFKELMRGNGLQKNSDFVNYEKKKWEKKSEPFKYGDDYLGESYESFRFYDDNLGKSNESLASSYDYIGKSRESLHSNDSYLGKSSKSLKLKANYLGNSNESLASSYDYIGESPESLQSNDIYLGKSRKSSKSKDSHLGKSRKSLKSKDSYLGKSRKSLKSKDSYLGKSNESLASGYDYIGESRESLHSNDSYLGKSSKSLKMKDNYLGNSNESLASSYDYIGESRESLHSNDSYLGKSSKSLKMKANYLGNSNESLASSYDYIGKSRESLQSNDSYGKKYGSANYIVDSDYEVKENDGDSRYGDNYVESFESARHLNKYSKRPRRLPKIYVSVNGKYDKEGITGLRRKKCDTCLISMLTKFLKKSDAMYETEVVKLMSTNYKRPVRGSFGKSKIAKLFTVASPIITNIVFLIISILLTSDGGFITSVLLLFLSLIYVWRKVSKSKKLCTRYEGCKVRGKPLRRLTAH